MIMFFDLLDEVNRKGFVKNRLKLNANKILNAVAGFFKDLVGSFGLQPSFAAC